MPSQTRMQWLDAIERALVDSDKPLHSTEIANISIRNGWVKPAAKFPDHSVQAAVWRHIKEAGNPKGFVMVGSGRIERCYWLKRKPKSKV